MSQVKEYVGRKSIEAVNYDGKGNDLFNMWLTDEEIVRCRDCKHCEIEEVDYDMGEVRNELECYLTGLETKPDGFCSWGERK